MAGTGMSLAPNHFPLSGKAREAGLGPSTEVSRVSSDEEYQEFMSAGLAAYSNLPRRAQSLASRGGELGRGRRLCYVSGELPTNPELSSPQPNQGAGQLS